MHLARNTNHPQKGSLIKVEPIRDVKAIRRIKKLYADKPRDLALFTFGINTAYRANEILSLKIGQISHLEPGDQLEIWQSKTRKYRSTTLNSTVVAALQAWLAVHPKQTPDATVFLSQRSRKALTVSTLNNMVKQWCKEVGLRGNYGSHTLRKTWGYHQRVQNNAAIPLLMEAFGHSTQAQTLSYLCVQDEEIADLYTMEL